MVAAYAFALQALLGAVLLSQAAATDTSPFAICVTSNDGTPNHSGGGKASPHEHCVLCSLGQASLDVAGGVAAIEPKFAVSVISISFATERVAYFASPTGQFQRGPPLAA